MDARPALLAGLFLTGAAVGAAGATSLHRRLRQQWDDGSLGPFHGDGESPLASADDSKWHTATQGETTLSSSPDAAAPIDAKISSPTSSEGDGAKLAER
jgi:hypothetical protein